MGQAGKALRQVLETLLMQKSLKSLVLSRFRDAPGLAQGGAPLAR
jgi:hypothetical protein